MNNTMRIKPTSTCESLWIYYIIIVINLSRASVTSCGHFQGVFLRRTHVLCVVSLLSHSTLSQIILSVFYILTYIMNHKFKT